MDETAERRDISISMRLREGDLDLIDRGAELNGLSRTEFVRRAAVQNAQMAILNETIVRMSPDAFEDFVAAISAPPRPMPAKMLERLSRPAPWDKR
jgi:uncharacterized protein (DUF1778 family)